MDFGYLDIVDETPLKKDDNIFVIPKMLRDKRVTWDGLEHWYGTYLEGNNFQDLTGTNKTRSGEKIIKLKYSISDIVYKLEDSKRICTVKPKPEVIKMIKAILETMEHSAETKIFISQVPLDNSSSLGFDGISFYIADDILACSHDGKYFYTDIPFKKKAMEDFKYLDKKYKHGIPVEKDDYPEFVKQTIKEVRVRVGKNFDKEIENHARNYKAYLAPIKALVPDYKNYLKVKPIINKFKAEAPKEIISLLEAGEKTQKNAYSAIKDHSLTCRSYVMQAMKKRKEKNFFALFELGSDWKAVQKMIKDGIIETVVYKSGFGLSWIYSPTMYDTTDNGKIFLGRVKVTLLEKAASDDPRHFLKFEMISYPENDGKYYGTYHFYGRGAGTSICIGQFASMFKNLAYGGKVSNLISVCRDYIQSVNVNSKHIRELAFTEMSLDNPKVIDDSFEVWKKNKKEVAARTVIEAGEEYDHNNHNEELDI